MEKAGWSSAVQIWVEMQAWRVVGHIDFDKTEIAVRHQSFAMSLRIFEGVGKPFTLKRIGPLPQQASG